MLLYWLNHIAAYRREAAQVMGYDSFVISCAASFWGSAIPSKVGAHVNSRSWMLSRAAQHTNLQYGGADSLRSQLVWKAGMLIRVYQQSPVEESACSLVECRNDVIVPCKDLLISWTGWARVTYSPQGDSKQEHDARQRAIVFQGHWPWAR